MQLVSLCFLEVVDQLVVVLLLDDILKALVSRVEHMFTQLSAEQSPT